MAWSADLREKVAESWPNQLTWNKDGGIMAWTADLEESWRNHSLLWLADLKERWQNYGLISWPERKMAESWPDQLTWKNDGWFMTWSADLKEILRNHGLISLEKRWKNHGLNRWPGRKMAKSWPDQLTWKIDGRIIAWSADLEERWRNHGCHIHQLSADLTNRLVRIRSP
jgi:hypothetical protein